MYVLTFGENMEYLLRGVAPFGLLEICRPSNNKKKKIFVHLTPIFILESSNFRTKNTFQKCKKKSSNDFKFTKKSMFEKDP